MQMHITATPLGSLLLGTEAKFASQKSYKSFSIIISPPLSCRCLTVRSTNQHMAHSTRAKVVLSNREAPYSYLLCSNIAQESDNYNDGYLHFQEGFSSVKLIFAH